jgi:hypothetical protein
VADNDQNRPKRRVSCRLAIGTWFAFFLRVFYILTDDFQIKTSFIHHETLYRLFLFLPATNHPSFHRLWAAQPFTLPYPQAPQTATTSSRYAGPVHVFSTSVTVGNINDCRSVESFTKAVGTYLRIWIQSTTSKAELGEGTGVGTQWTTFRQSELEGCLGGF